MPAVLDRPDDVRPETFPSPHHRLGMPDRDRCDDLLAELATRLVDGDEGVRALVYIGSNNNHGGCLHSLRGDGWAGRRTNLSGGDATLLSSHAGRSFTPDAGKTHARQPEGSTDPTSQTPGDQDPTTAITATSPSH